MLKSVFDFVAPANASATKLNYCQEYANINETKAIDTPLKGLVYRFDVCSSSVSRIMLLLLYQESCLFYCIKNHAFTLLLCTCAAVIHFAYVST